MFSNEPNNSEINLRVSSPQGVGIVKETPFSIPRDDYTPARLSDLVEGLKERMMDFFIEAVKTPEFHFYSYNLEFAIHLPGQDVACASHFRGLLRMPELTKEEFIQIRTGPLMHSLDKFIQGARRVGSEQVSCSLEGSFKVYSDVVWDSVHLQGQSARAFLDTMSSAKEKIIGVSIDPEGNSEFLSELSFRPPEDKRYGDVG